jgi:predicted Zn-dependent protease
MTAVRAAPDSREAQFALAEVMTAQGDRASAAYQRGLYYLQTDRPDRALTEFQRISTIAPDRVAGAMMTSLALIRLRRFGEAAAEAERGLARHPHDTQLLAQLGMTHLLGRNRPRVAQLCQSWLKFDPSAAEPYRLLARVAREEQRLPDAQRLAEQALARDPQNPIVCAELAKTLAATATPENRARAIELLQRAVAANPQEPDYWQEMGELLRAAGRPAEAADAWLRALDLDPNSVPACAALVATAAEQRRPESSRFYAGLVTEMQARTGASASLWRAAYTHPKDARTRAQLVQALLEAGDLRRASYQLQELAVLRPGDAAVRRELARVEFLRDLP